MKLYLLRYDKKSLWEGTEDGLQSISYEARARIPNRHFLHHLHATPNAETRAAMAEADSITRTRRARFGTATKLFKDLEKKRRK